MVAAGRSLSCRGAVQHRRQKWAFSPNLSGVRKKRPKVTPPCDNGTLMGYDRYSLCMIHYEGLQINRLGVRLYFVTTGHTHHNQSVNHYPRVPLPPCNYLRDFGVQVQGIASSCGQILNIQY
jgi:hypothetical protein